MKHRICTALLSGLFSFLFVPTVSLCQEAVSTSLVSNSASIPDTPSATHASTCAKDNGKPCPEWVHKLIGQYPPSTESSQPPLQRGLSSVHFWTYRGWQEPPLRTNKQVFRSKLFIGAHIGGAIAMIVACRTKTSKEEWHSEVPAVVGMFGMDYLQFRFIGGPNAMVGPVYEMIHYGLASMR